MKNKVLYIDDEVENLKAFTRVFKKDYDIITADSGEKGLELVEQHPDIKLLVSDQRMPGMSGVDFLNASKHINSKAIRIIITGYADLESTINAINEAEIYRFVSKPWEKLDLKQTFEQALEKYRLKEELLQKNQELLSLDKLKDKFMMLVNHELKTPLTVQKSYLELLKSEELNSDQELYLSKSIEGSERLEVLVQEILYFLKIQKSDLLEDSGVFELKELIENSSATQDSEIKMNESLKLKSSQEHFGQALQRLAQNAEQHKSLGSKVQITLENHELVIENKIDATPDLDLIIKAFEINEDAFNHSKGLGLGLSVALLILNKLAFKVEVKAHEKFEVRIDLSQHLA